jgi:hexosaminidase
MVSDMVDIILRKKSKKSLKYATARNINVIPEIEMPGHAQAALAAYPELGCENKKYEVATKWGVFEDVYCPNEVTFTFLEDVHK